MDTEHELDRFVDLTALADTEQRVQFEATEEERAAVAKRLDVNGIEALRFDARTRRGADGDIRVDLRIRAKVLRECVVTLKETPEAIDERISLRFSSKTVTDGFEHEDSDGDLSDESLEGADAEPLGDGSVNLGEYAVQYLSLSLDPYPRAKGAELADEYRPEDIEEDTSADSPFAALGALKTAKKHDA